MDLPYYREYELPWTSAQGQEERFRRLLAIVFAVLLFLGVVWPYLPTPAVDPWCANRPEKAGPFLLDAALAAKRRGTGAKTYADADSTKDQPVETCGTQGARDWLEKTRCPDGSEGEQLGRFAEQGGVVGLPQMLQARLDVVPAAAQARRQRRRPLGAGALGQRFAQGVQARARDCAGGL